MFQKIQMGFLQEFIVILTPLWGEIIFTLKPFYWMFDSLIESGKAILDFKDFQSDKGEKCKIG